ncbi:hypothetical protein [Agromyces subbeticus]|uniref:hypothetical protein n=1 Tax=Agromyces subbeticus TaxID=293890 RepID=UPI0003B773B0|nr:hypothetical protein [Agromyces subbeticus]
MTSEPSIEAAAAQATTGGTESGPIPHRIRIRWGWFLGCIVLGLAAIIAGWFLVSPESRLGYVGGVFAGVGTTLLLVGIVVLLERRIIGTAVRVVQDATKEARIRADEAVRAQIRDLEHRVAGLWEAAPPEDAAEQTRTMIDEFTRRVADAYIDADDAAPDGRPR